MITDEAIDEIRLIIDTQLSAEHTRGYTAGMAHAERILREKDMIESADVLKEYNEIPF